MGSLAVDCPQIAMGQVRIRRAEARRPGSGLWFSTDPLRAAIADGKALFPWVGVGVEIEYEVRGAAGGQELRGTLSGPTRAGERVVFTCPTDEGFPLLMGRVVDEERRPVAGQELSLTITHHNGGSSSRGYPLATDAEGRFRFLLRETDAHPGVHRTVYVSGPQGASLKIEPASELAAGDCDLGDVQLVAPGSDRWLRGKDDAALEAEYRRAVAGAARYGSNGRLVETCLTEMVRRGGSRWQEFLAAELAQARAVAADDDVEDLELLTALRRAQGRGDPLALELVDGASELECTFPWAPTVHLTLRNVDVERQTFHLTFGGDYRSGRFARCRVEARDAHGSLIEPLPSPGFMGGGMLTRAPLPPGQAEDFMLPLGLYIQWPSPGEYQVRVQYHDQQSIDEERDVSGWILTTSPVFTVRVAPLRVEARRAELDALAAQVAALDVSQPVLLVSGHWSADMSFQGEPATPQDHLFRAGWKSLPVLLDALENKGLEPTRRAWVLGMLWNIAGIHNPANRRALGAYRWAESWPGASLQGHPTLAEFGESTHASIEWEEQLALSLSWLALRKGIELTVVE